MSSKPSKVPRLGATAPGVITGTIVEPSEDKKTAGFVTRERPPSQFLTWLFELIYEWIQYLSDGALSGDHSIAGSFAVGGQPLAFTNLTFTADASTDTLTHVAHGLQTGDGPVRVSSTGTLPGGLAISTDYWVIGGFPVGDGFQLATSLANALAGTAIDITTTGSGTHTLLHQFSTARVFDATVSKDLTVGGNLTTTGSATVNGKLFHEIPWQHSIGFALPDASASLSIGVAGTTATRLALLASTGDNSLPLMIPVGVITKWSVTLNKASATGTITARLYESTNASGAGPTQIGSTQSNGASAPGAITLGQTGVNFTMTLGREYFVIVNGGGTTGDMVTSYYVATTGI